MSGNPAPRRDAPDGRGQHPTPTASRVATLRDALYAQPAAGTVQRSVRGPLRVAFWAALRAGLHLQVEGLRHEGPSVVVSNHPNLIDGLIVLFADPTMRPVARWHRNPMLRVGMWIAASLITTTGTPVTPHRGAYASALAHLRAGGRLWIAPEGGWQPTLTLRYPRTGAVRLAHAVGVPIQILAIVHGAHPGPTLATWRGWPRPRVLLRWGPVVTTTGDVAADIDAMMVALGRACGATWRRPDTTARTGDAAHE
ncbi:MAG: 1-acyl-sn-glycerol-3-phosphate acyltransferase [Actinobacteria bacterium]|nr:1-acyl-sn-glycerol-3-phosphate acyltransferase [Actinomycetota bacterium]